MTTSLRSIAIFVHDLEKARAFYEDALGLPIARAGSFGYELLDTPPHIGIHPATHPDARPLVGRHTGLTFAVTDLLGLCSTLGNLGVQFVAEPTQQGFGIMAMIADPDGNIMALWEDNMTPPEPG